MPDGFIACGLMRNILGILFILNVANPGPIAFPNVKSLKTIRIDATSAIMDALLFKRIFLIESGREKCIWAQSPPIESWLVARVMSWVSSSTSPIPFPIRVSNAFFGIFCGMLDNITRKVAEPVISITGKFINCKSLILVAIAVSCVCSEASSIWSPRLLDLNSSILNVRLVFAETSSAFLSDCIRSAPLVPNHSIASPTTTIPRPTPSIHSIIGCNFLVNQRKENSHLRLPSLSIHRLARDTFDIFINISAPSDTTPISTSTVPAAAINSNVDKSIEGFYGFEMVCAIITGIAGISIVFLQSPTIA
jgi:hypothetical protein